MSLRLSIVRAHGRKATGAALPRVAGQLVVCLLGFLCVTGGPGDGDAQPTSDLPPWAGRAQQPSRPDLVFPRLPENAEILTLENGLQVILLRNPAQPMVGIYTLVRVGSAYEDFRTSGMSHMLEHLLFNGTQLYTQEQLYALADRVGAYNNANTTNFYTNVMMVLPSQALETGLQMQSQMLFHALIPADKFEKERGIVVGEIVQGRDRDYDYAEEALRELLYAGSSLALPTIGTLATIESMKRDDVYAFYKNHYVPNNMITMLAGNFERTRALELLRRYYGKTPPGTVHRPDLLPAIFVDRTQTLTRPGGDRPCLMLAFDAPSYGSPDFFPFLVLTRLLTAPGEGILTRALNKVAQAKRPELSTHWERADGFGRLILRFDLKSGDDPGPYHRLVQDALASALEWGITDDEVLRVVRLEETETVINLEQLRMLSITGGEMIVLGGPDFFLNYLSRLREVRAQDVAQTVNGYLLDAVCLALYVQPLGAGGWSEATEATSMPSGGGSSGTPPAPAASDEPEVRRTLLANGAVVVTQRNRGSPLFAAHLTVRNRAMLDGAHPGALNLVHRLLTSGVGGCDATCLQGKLGRLGAVIKLVDDPRIPMDDYYTNGRFAFIRLECAAENGPDALVLMMDLITKASFTATDFARERDVQLAQVVRQRGSAATTANRRLDEALFGSHPLGRPVEGDAASLKELTFEHVQQLYRKAFAPPNLIVAVVSSFDHDELVRLIAGNLPGGRAEPAGAMPPPPVTRESQRVTASLGGQMAAIRIGSLMQVAAPDRRPLELLVAILSNRMGMTLREQQGLSYSIGASYDPMPGGHAEFQAWLNPPRERLAEGQRALLEFVAGFDAETITQDELTKTRSALLGRLMMRRLASISQAYYLAMAELDGDLSSYNRMLTAYDSVDLADLRRVGERYFDTMQLVTVVVD